jgi:hypothetical protein
MIDDKPYKGFSVGQKVVFLSDTPCQYYDYPRGTHLLIAKTGQIGVIKSIPPKVRITSKGTGSYFFNVEMDGEIYPVLDYHNIKAVK